MDSQKTKQVYFIIRNIFGQGGAERLACALAKELQRKHLQVEILTTRQRRVGEDNILRGTGIPVVMLRTLKIRIIGSLLYYCSLVFYLARHRSEYELTQVFFLKKSAFVATIMGKILKKKVVCFIPGGGKYGDVSILGKMKFRHFYLEIFKKLDAIVAPSRDSRDELLGMFPKEKVVFIPNGVEVERFKPQFDNETKMEEKTKYGLPQKKLITFVGRFSHEKGLDFLLRAFQKLSMHIPPIFKIR